MLTIYHEVEVDSLESSFSGITSVLVSGTLSRTVSGMFFTLHSIQLVINYHEIVLDKVCAISFPVRRLQGFSLHK